MIVNKANSDQIDLISALDSKLDRFQQDLDVIYADLEKAELAVNNIRNKIKPIRAEMAPFAEMKAGIVSRQSRVKYFPEFATRNHDNTKDAAFYEFVKSAINNV